MDGPSYSSSDMVVSEPLVRILLWARADAEAVIERDAGADTGDVEE